MINNALVMIVADKKDQAYFRAKILASNDYQAICFQNGEEELELIRGGKIPNLPLTDIECRYSMALSFLRNCKDCKLKSAQL